MEEKNQPLSIVMENTKGKLNSAFGQIINESKLPAYLIEGMLVEILAEIRNQKNKELVFDISNMKNKNEEEK